MNGTDGTVSGRAGYWTPVLCGALILTIGIGARQSFGIFQGPIAADLGVGREVWSFANAVALLLMGILSPFAGILADRSGSGRTIGVGATLYAGGMFLIATATDGAQILVGNALGGVGMAAAGFGPILAALGRLTPPHARSVALGVATAGGSFGQFAIVPLASALQARLADWHTTMMVLAVTSLAMLPLAIGLREHRQTETSAVRQTSGAALREALQVRGFWLLTTGFFVCGFHVSFIGLHLPSYIADHGVHMTLRRVTFSAAELGGLAIGTVGLFNVLGSVLWGWLGGRRPRKDMLALLYLLRVLAFALFLALPLSASSVLLFAATLGFLWLGTIPLTSGLLGYMFGDTHLSMLWGIVFLSHQIGSFMGSWLPGRLYDLQGNYDQVWWLSIALGLLAAALHWGIRERPASMAPEARPMIEPG